ncbi:HNH endonuclease signature motif containing protein [Phytohabitans suffuscus]|uniref:HNH endonuclease signature motif containing protein n=1 Tax=Phytohabitans suffuscus TaxID=624315 RepID=UPI001567AA88|nr:HNH endonuclease signature motif containing protein [Phytohabitans suffuscus]
MLDHVGGLSRHHTPESLRALLLARSTRRPDGCLIVQGYGTRRGIHQKIAGRAWAHIVAYAVFVGEIDPDLEVDHTCGAKDCVEPTHLRQVSHADNCRSRVPAPTCRNGHEREIDPSTGRLRRQCRACNAEAQRRWRARQADERSASLTPAGLAASKARRDAVERR